jgi:class 3 adenylate cyclase
VPIAFSPTIGVHLMITGALPGYELALPLLCFLLAGTFHVWGTMLLVDLFNDHLQSEARHSGAGSLRRMIAEDNVNSRTEEVQPERELLAIMLTDIFGYSKAMERDEKRTYTKLVEHNRLIRSAIGTYRGREIDTIGDAFLVTFHSALDAVDCALAVQRTFKDLNLGRESDDRLLVRIGIHLGDVLITGNRVYGDAVNVASRIESLAEPGGICVSEPVFEMVRKKVQLDVERIEGVQLKNIEVAPRLYRIKLPD